MVIITGREGTLRYPFRIWAEIDLEALAWNLARIRREIAPRQGIILVVKADAYGHGATLLARRAEAEGVAMFGVGNCREALELLEAGVKRPVLILGTIIDEEISTVAREGIHVGVHSSSRLDRFSSEALRARRRLRVHLNVDTGMGRLGVFPREAPRLAEEILSRPGLELAGIYTHFAFASFPPSREMREQERTFSAVVADLRRRGLLPRTAIVHGANSAALFAGLGEGYDAVRPGLAAYGILPGEFPAARDLEPVLSLRSQVIFYKDVPAGAQVGYEGTWKAPKPTRIATVPVGFNDGIPWRLGLQRGAFALVRGRRVPFAGRVSMDYLCLDIGDVPGVQVGDPVTLIGRDGGEEITAMELARLAGTTPYEILSRLGKRVRRVALHQRTGTFHS